MEFVSLPPPAAAASPAPGQPQAATAYLQALRLDVGQWLPPALNDTVARLQEASRGAASHAQRADLSENAAVLAENQRAWSR